MRVLITGATSGIGEKLAELCESKGLQTILTGRHIDKLARFKGEKIACDLAADRTPLLEAIRSQAPDIIINNAGFGLYGEALSLSFQEQLEMVEVNSKALLEITLEGAKALRALGKGGVILNIASAAAFQPFPNFAVYSATKAFVLSLSQSLDGELADHGIRVLVSCPGRVATDFSSRASKEPRQASPDKMTTEFAAQEIWRQIERKKRVHIFDGKYRLLIRIGQFFIPNCWLGSYLKRTLDKKR
jgi:hypothetical protein